MSGPLGFHDWLHLAGAVVSSVLLTVVFFAAVREACLGLAKVVASGAAKLREWRNR